MYHSVSRCHQLGSLCWGREVYRNSSLSAQFCCEPKTSLKNEIYFFKEFTVLNILNNIKLSILQPKKQWIKQLRKRFNLLQPEEEKGKKKPPCCRACLVTSQGPWQRGRGFPFGLEPSERTQQRVLADTGALSEGPLLTRNTTQRSQTDPFNIHMQMHLTLDFISGHLTSFFVMCPDRISIFNLGNWGTCELTQELTQKPK